MGLHVRALALLALCACIACDDDDSDETGDTDAGSTPDAASSSQDAAAPDPDAAPTPDAAEPPVDAAAPTPDAGPSGPAYDDLYNWVCHPEKGDDPCDADPRIDDIGGDLLDGWGLHLVDITLLYGDLVDLAASQGAAWGSR